MALRTNFLGCSCFIGLPKAKFDAIYSNSDIIFYFKKLAHVFDQVKGPNWIALTFQVYHDLVKKLKGAAVDDKSFVSALLLFHTPTYLKECPEVGNLGCDAFKEAQQHER